MSSFGDDPIKDLGFVVFPASAGLDQRDCLFLSAPLAQLLFRGSLNKELGRISD